MDFSSLLTNVESLAFIYAWTLLAAGTFALGEKVVGDFSAQKARVKIEAKDQ